MPICIPKHAVQKFKEDLKSGKIDFDALMDMSSAQRRQVFAKQFGKEAASEVNALFESKLLLKYQKRGMIDWVKTVAGMKPEQKRDIISKVLKLDKALTPENDIFLEDLASQKLGTTVTAAEAAKISTFAKKVARSKEIMENSKRRTLLGRPTKAEMNYGASVVAFEKYLAHLKEDKRTRLQKAKAFLNPLTTISAISGSAKQLKASLDNSFIGRQGIRLFYLGLTGDVGAGKTWMNTFFKSFDMIFKTLNPFQETKVLDTLRAEILSDPDYDLMRKAGIATATVEEDVPFSWPERLPLIGKLFEASDVAFTGSAYYMRYRTAKQILNVARNTGVDLTDKNELQSIGKLVNSLTARGDTGSKSQKPGFINNVIWSPRMIKANFDVLTVHAGDKGFSKFARKRAAVNLLRIISGQAFVLMLASLLIPDSVEWDPRSPNFGKIQVGNTRFDITGGMAPFVTLAARVLPIFIPGVDAAVKSGVTGEIKKLNDGGFFGRTGEDVVYDFFANKFSPAAAVVRDHLRGRTFDRETPSLKTSIRDLGVPIPITTYPELKKDPAAANIIVAMIAEEIGIGAQNYDSIKTWPIADLEAEIHKNTHQKAYRRKDKETGVVTTAKAGDDHKGKSSLVKVVRDMLERRTGSRKTKKELDRIKKSGKKVSKSPNRGGLGDIMTKVGIQQLS